MNTSPLFFIVIAGFIFFLSGCSHEYTPKPMGYLRIDLPEKTYRVYDSEAPYKFEYPGYAKVIADKSFNTEPYWINLDFPKFKGRIHISYKDVNNNIAKFLDDTRTLVYKHTIKADAINEKLYTNSEKKVYGILYDIKGNTASSVQFYLTDSTTHFLRGALYFNVEPNKDSLAPVVNFIHKDIEHLIETFEWK
ncbi:MAG: gliding motility lipoprotein GldD [Bacteroidia bacterium]|nr:gliding motility lipoprotein GldD [Bacteroidia bacterium]